MYWRTTDNTEVDFVIQHGRSVVAVEVKATARPGLKDWQKLTRFVAEHSKACRGALLLHAGDEITRVADKVLLAPWWRVL